jgi:hypothetical protein
LRDAERGCRLTPFSAEQSRTARRMKRFSKFSTMEFQELGAARAIFHQKMDCIDE